MTKEEARALDVILSAFTPKAWRIRVSKEENELCETLEKLGYIEIYNHNPDGYFILLTDHGNTIKAKGGIEAQFKQMEKEKEINDLRLEYLKSNLNVAKSKRESVNWTKIGVWVAIAGLIITIAIAILSQY
jgi:hypothetical protein